MPAAVVISKAALAAPLDPFSNDETTRVSVEIAGVEYPLIKQYSLETDVLNLGDPCSVELPNPTGQLNGKINLGDPLMFYMADPHVNGGQRIKMLTGIVTRRQAYSNRSGTFVSVAGADLGWHLVKNDAPLWFRLRGAKWSQLLNKVIDSTWGFSKDASGNYYRWENNTNTALRHGRQGVVQQISGSLDAFVPPIQTEPGEKIADILILYARRDKRLVNVSSDGFLQLWTPQNSMKGQALYTFHYHRADEPAFRKNNVEDATLIQDAETVFTDVQCVGSVVRPPDLQSATNPNEGQFIGIFQTPPPPFVGTSSPLPFWRRCTFSDGDQLTRQQAVGRAAWKWQRGVFDAFVYQITVRGHQQDGAFFTENTIANVDDTVNGVQGPLYVTSVRKSRVRGRAGGTRSTITMHQMNLLGA